MRIKLLSDLHLEFAPLALTYEGEDLLILAGDICPSYEKALELIQGYLALSSDTPVILVLGNHDYYGQRIADVNERWQRAKIDRLHILQDQSVVLNGIRFYGSTMWTNIPQGLQSICARAINDYRQIIDFTPQDGCDIHSASALKLATALTKSEEDVVVITHHLPSFRSVEAKYAGNLANAAFASSDLDALIHHEKVRVWCHGHTHTNLDYVDHGTRVLCNPRGYMRRFKDLLVPENPDFNHIFTFTIGASPLSNPCKYSFKDLLLAAGRDDNTDKLYTMTQQRRNNEVKRLCEDASWHWHDEISDGAIYTAFAPERS